MCDKAYVAKSYLKKHFKMQHDTAVPFACDFPGCGQRFKVNYLLQAHIKQVHSASSSFQCTQCKAGFGKRSDLKRHCQNRHGFDIDMTGGYGL